MKKTLTQLFAVLVLVLGGFTACTYNFYTYTQPLSPSVVADPVLQPRDEVVWVWSNSVSISGPDSAGMMTLYFDTTDNVADWYKYTGYTLEEFNQESNPYTLDIADTSGLNFVPDGSVKPIYPGGTWYTVEELADTLRYSIPDTSGH